MTRKNELPDVLELDKIFVYNTENGWLYWLPKLNDVRWNRVFAGKRAGGLDRKGYIRIRSDGKIWNAHRVIWKMVHRQEPEYIDHINGNRSDNRVSNLRSVTKLENSRNAAIGKNNTSGTNGVHWVNREQRWRACIYYDNRKVSLGDYVNKEDAVKARKKADIEFGYHENHGRVRHGYRIHTNEDNTKVHGERCQDARDNGTSRKREIDS